MDDEKEDLLVIFTGEEGPVYIFEIAAKAMWLKIYEKILACIRSEGEEKYPKLEVLLTELGGIRDPNVNIFRQLRDVGLEKLRNAGFKEYTFFEA